MACWTLQGPERESFIDDLLVRIHFIIEIIRWTGLAPWEFEFSFPGSLTSTCLLQGLLSHTWSRPDAARLPFAKPRRFIKTHRLKPKSWNRNSEPEKRNRNPKSETQNRKLKIGTRHPEVETRDTRRETRNPKPETRNLKSRTRNPRYEPRNPKPETRNQELEPRSLHP